MRHKSWFTFVSKVNQLATKKFFSVTKYSMVATIIVLPKPKMVDLSSFLCFLAFEVVTFLLKLHCSLIDCKMLCPDTQNESYAEQVLGL